MIKKLLSLLLEFTQTITVSLSVFVIIYLFLATPTEVLGYSMEPTLDHQERLIVEKVSVKLNKLERGEIVVVKSPVQKETDYVKRLIGLPGDSIEIKDCHLYLNNQIFEENYLAPETCTKGMQFLSENFATSIPDEKYLVMGDNREHSFDGRSFGFIDKSAIEGRALIRWWPIDKWKIF